jgi:hypothetical protein
LRPPVTMILRVAVTSRTLTTNMTTTMLATAMILSRRTRSQEPCNNRGSRLSSLRYNKKQNYM